MRPKSTVLQQQQPPAIVQAELGPGLDDPTGRPGNDLLLITRQLQRQAEMFEAHQRDFIELQKAQLKAQTTAIQQQISWGTTMQQMNASTNRRKNTDIEIPKTIIPAFSGDQLGWTQFWTRFKTAVHDKTSLSAIQKFNILEPLLFGKARRTVINLVLSEASYNEAITKLLAMYDDKEVAIYQHLAGLNNLPSVDHEHDLDGLLNLQFSIVTHINGRHTQG